MMPMSFHSSFENTELFSEDISRNILDIYNQII